MIVKRRLAYSNLAAFGLTAADVSQIVQYPNGTTELTFVNPVKEAAFLTEEEAIAKAGDLIDAISNLAEAKVFLKRLCKRLIANGVLP